MSKGWKEDSRQILFYEDDEIGEVWVVNFRDGEGMQHKVLGNMEEVEEFLSFLDVMEEVHA